MTDEDRADALGDALRSLLHAVQPVLAAHRSTEAHVTEEQITKAWALYDHGRDVLRRSVEK